jgi:hypothetical protein
MRSIGAPSVRRNAGITAVPADSQSRLDDLGLTRILLERVTDLPGGNTRRFQIGNETLTAGQLRLEADRNPTRFADFLRANGVSPAEFNELLDDVLNMPNPPATIDLRSGSALARQYRIGGARGEDVDLHLDGARMRERARRSEGIARRLDLREARLSGPDPFTAIGEAFAEAAAWVGRIFGGTWNPDTVTFNGRSDCERHRRMGRDIATSRDALAFFFMLSSPEGEQRLRQILIERMGNQGTAAQRERAADEMIAGMKEAFSGQTKISKNEAHYGLIYLAACDFSEESRRDIEHVLAQPPRVRRAALRLLTELPEADRRRMLELFRAPPVEMPEADRAFRAYDAQSVYREASPAEQEAMFEVLRRDGFRHAIDSHELADLTAAIRASRDTVPEAYRARYLALLPQLGLSRVYLGGDHLLGLATQLGRLNPLEADRLLTQIEQNLDSTDDLVRTLAASEVKLRLVVPSGGIIISAEDRRLVREAMESANLRLRIGAERLDIDRWLSDATYREDVSSRTGLRRAAVDNLLRNVAASVRESRSPRDLADMQTRVADLRAELSDPHLDADARSERARELRGAELELASLRAPANLEIDLSRGSRLDTLFGLRDANAEPAMLQLARERINGAAGADIRVRFRTGQEISMADMHNITREGFATRYPGMNYAQTITAFANLADRYALGELPEPADGSQTFRIDLRQRRLPNGPGSVLETPLGATSSATRTDASRLWNESRLGAVAGNNWFQYGFFTANGGYHSSVRAHDAARDAFIAGGRTQDPQHALRGLFALDGYARSNMHRDGLHRELGIAHGRPEDFTGNADDFAVLSFTGRGSSTDRTAFRATSARIRDMFDRYGGVEDIEVQNDPSPSELYRAVEAELLSGKQNVVVHFAGHTASNRVTDQVEGFILTGTDGRRAFFSTEQMSELNRIARERGVNLIWATDACRSGDYVGAASDMAIAENDALGRLSPETRALQGLEQSLRLYHSVHEALRVRGPRMSPMPDSRTLARMTSAALAGGPNSDAMRALIAIRDRVGATPNMDADNVRIMNLAVESVEGMQRARATLSTMPGVDPQILNNGLLTGATAWRSGYRFMTFELGALSDRINGAVRSGNSRAIVVE